MRNTYICTALLQVLLSLGPIAAQAENLTDKKPEDPVDSKSKPDLKLHLQFQYRTCTLETAVPIFNERTDEQCGIARTEYYDDGACPPATFKSCEDPAHGVSYWEDITTTKGVHPDRRKNGYGSKEDCVTEGNDWITRANKGQGGVKAPGFGRRYDLLSVKWDGEDITAPITGNRIKASHRCTYYYGISRAHWVVKRSEHCEVASRHQCKERKVFNTCRLPDFDIEGYEEVTERDSACGLRIEPGYVRLIDGDPIPPPGKQFWGIGIVVGAKMVPDDDFDFTIATQCTAEPVAADRYYCLKLNEKALASLSPERPTLGNSIVEQELQTVRALGKQALLRAMSSGDLRATYHQLLGRYVREENFATTDVDSAKAFHSGFRSTISDLPDGEYFDIALRLANQAMQSRTSATPQDKGTIQSPLWDVLAEQDLSRRRVPFKLLSDLKVLVTSADPMASDEFRGANLIVADFLIRAYAAYIDQRAFDVLQLEATASDLRRENANVATSIRDTTTKVRAMKLAPKVEDAVLLQIQATASSAQLMPIVRDLIKTAKQDIDHSIEEAESTISTLTAKDPLNKVHVATLRLKQGSYNHAVLAMRESAAEFRKVPDSKNEVIGASGSFTRFRDNFKYAIKASLDKADAAFSGLSSSPQLTLDVLSLPSDQLVLSYALMDSLGQLQIAIGSNLANVRIQLLNHINTTIIEPLRSAQSQF